MFDMMTAEGLGIHEVASGANFDEMFLQMMILHNSGAVTMAETELVGSLDLDLRQLLGS